MFPGMGGMDPKQMQSLLRQMGVHTTELDVERVVFEKTDGSKLVVTSPQVTQIEMKGAKSFQVAGSVSEEAGAGSGHADDVKIVMMQTGATADAAQQALDSANGDLAEAILKLKSK